MTNVYSIALSGLESLRRKAEGHASNIANMSSFGSVDGTHKAYSPVDTVSYSDGINSGVRTETILRDPAQVTAYSPGSPFANEEGVIAVPNISLEHEIVGMQFASTMYKAGAAVIRTQKEMDEEVINIIT